MRTAISSMLRKATMSPPSPISARKLNPNDATVLYSRPEAKLKSGDTAAADADIAAAEALRPDSGIGPAKPGEVR